MATGDITAVRINSAGWYAEIDIEGLDTGGAYAMGWGANNDPSTCKVVLTVTSPSWSDTGASTTIERTVYGTIPKRLPYPDHATKDETDNSTYVTVRVALSEWIYDTDTVEADVSSGTIVRHKADGDVYSGGNGVYGGGAGQWNMTGTSSMDWNVIFEKCETGETHRSRPSAILF